MRDPDEIADRLDDFERRSVRRETNDTAVQHFRLGAMTALDWVLSGEEGR